MQHHSSAPTAVSVASRGPPCLVHCCRKAGELPLWFVCRAWVLGFLFVASCMSTMQTLPHRRLSSCNILVTAQKLCYDVTAIRAWAPSSQYRIPEAAHVLHTLRASYRLYDPHITKATKHSIIVAQCCCTGRIIIVAFCSAATAWRRSTCKPQLTSSPAGLRLCPTARRLPLCREMQGTPARLPIPCAQGSSCTSITVVHLDTWGPLWVGRNT